MDKCSSKNLLKKSNLKITKQRVFLLDEIISSESSFSANSLYITLSNNMDLVTIYRILNLFNDKKIIREIINKNDTKYYELACIHHPIHPHFLCKKCKELYCLKELNNKDIHNLNKYSKNFIVEDVKIQFSGICDKCNLLANKT